MGPHQQQRPQQQLLLLLLLLLLPLPLPLLLLLLLQQAQQQQRQLQLQSPSLALELPLSLELEVKELSTILAPPPLILIGEGTTLEQMEPQHLQPSLCVSQTSILPAVMSRQLSRRTGPRSSI